MSDPQHAEFSFDERQRLWWIARTFYAPHRKDKDSQLVARALRFAAETSEPSEVTLPTEELEKRLRGEFP